MSEYADLDVLQELSTYFPKFDARFVQCKVDFLSRIEPDDGRTDVAEDGVLVKGEGLVACIPTKLTLIPTFVEPIVRSYRLHKQHSPNASSAVQI